MTGNFETSSVWTTRLALVVVMIGATSARSWGQAAEASLALDTAPVFRLEPGGPTTRVTGLGFGTGGKTLYVAGFDKVVQVWEFDEASGIWRFDRRATLRLPIGPGLEGVINTLAVSKDGAWVAAAGSGTMRGSAGFRQPGEVVPLEAMPELSRLDQGRITLFPRRGGGEPKSLVGHRGSVLALAFATEAAKTPLLVSAGIEGTEVIVRAWDVVTGKQVASSAGFAPGARITSPSVAVRSMGEAWEVALAWGDGPLRTWRLAGKTLTPGPSTNDGRRLTVLPAPGGGTWWSTRFEGARGILDAWPGADPGFPFPAGGRGQVNSLPESLALVTVPPATQPDHAAVLLRRETPNASTLTYLIQLIPLNPARRATARPPIELGDVAVDNHPAPVLTVDAGGSTLALAYQDDSSVAIHSVADLANGNPRPRQVLQGEGVTIRRAAFAQNGSRWGIALDPDRKALPGELFGSMTTRTMVLDLKSGVIGTNAGWRIAGPTPQAGWAARLRAPSLENPVPALVVSRPGLAEVVIPLERGDVVTDLALAPEPPAGAARLLAVGLRRVNDGPLLLAFDAATGTRVGQWSGHSDAIRSLAFSGDGRWLLSASDDRTVAAWDALELAANSDRTILGVRLTQGEAGLTVLTVDPKGPLASQDLKPSDRIVALYRDNAWDPVGNPRQLADAIFATPPGNSVFVSRTRDGQAKAVTFAITRAMAERKPVLTLFFGPSAGPADPWRWLAWTPSGSYDRSDAGIEGLVGWHFNAGSPGEPVRFASAADYRDRRTPGLIGRRFLGDPPPPPPSPIRAELRVVPDPRDVDPTVLLRRKPVSIQVELRDPVPPAGSIASATWSLDGAPSAKLEGNETSGWSADLGDCAPRAWHTVEATLTTRDTVPRVLTVREKFRFIPESPRLTVTPPPDRVALERLALIALLEAPEAGGELEARAWHAGEPAPAFEPVAPGRFERMINLQRGGNEIRIEARPMGVAPDTAAFETARFVARVERSAAETPTITLERSESTHLLPETGSPLAFMVEEPSARFAGIIRSKGLPLSEATLIDGEKPGRPLVGFVAGKAQEFRFSEELELADGPAVRVVRIRARAGDGEVAELALAVRHAPPVPGIDRIVLDPPGPDVFDRPDGTPPRLTFTATLRPHPGKPAARASVRLNDADVADVVTDPAGQTVTATTLLQPGRNELRLRLRNDRGVESSSAPVVVNYRRPPRVISVARGSGKVGRAIDLTAIVEAAEPPGTASAKLQRERPGASGPGEVDEISIDPEIIRQAPGKWLVTARDVPLRPGKNCFLVWAFNTDGRSLAPGQSEIFDHVEPPQHRLRAEFTEPARDSSTAQPSSRLRFRIEASAKLTQVAVHRKDESGREEPVFADRSPSEADGDTVATLVKGVNTFTLTAVDETGATARDEVTVAYEPPPLMATVDALVVGDREIPPVLGEGGKPTFPEVLESSWVKLRGSVRWPDEATRLTSPEVTVTVLVDGTPWWRKRVKSAPGDRTRPFETGLRLPASRSVLRVQLTGAAVDERAAVEHPVTCRPDSLRRRLRLLVVGVRPGDNRRALEAEALAAFRGRKRETAGEFEAPTFEKSFLYGPLTGEDAERARINGQIDVIRKRLTGLEEDAFEAPTEVVVIYYRGDERLSGSGRSLKLTRGEEIQLDEIHRRFVGRRGSEVFLLDVARDPGPDLANDFPDRLETEPGQARPVRLRVSWLGQKGDPPAADRLLGALQMERAGPTTLQALDEALRGHYLNRRSDLDYDPLLDPAHNQTILIGRGGQ